MNASAASKRISNFSWDEEEMMTVGRVSVGPLFVVWPVMDPSRRP